MVEGEMAAEFPGRGRPGDVRVRVSRRDTADSRCVYLRRLPCLDRRRSELSHESRKYAENHCLVRIMFSRSELVLVHHLANGLDTVDALMSATGLGQARVYRMVADLKRKGVLDPGRGIRISPDPFSLRLLHLMEPSAKRAGILADSGMEVLMELRSPRTVDEVVSALGASRATVYRHISAAMSAGAVSMDGERYVLNDRMWKGLREMLDSLADRMDAVQGANAVAGPMSESPWRCRPDLPLCVRLDVGPPSIQNQMCNVMSNRNCQFSIEVNRIIRIETIVGT